MENKIRIKENRFMAEGISVIVCCYNSAKRLPETLRHLALQDVPDNLAWEVIVINNNSTDNTGAVAKDEWGKYSTKALFRVIDEPNPGLSNARKTGILSANYAYTIFCDDDNWLAPNYLKTAFDIIANNPAIGMLGGQGIAYCEIIPPAWFEEKASGYAIGKQSKQSGDITTRGYIWGAGATLRTDLLKRIYHLNIESLLSGRKGEILNAGDDSEIAIWHIILGYKLWYDEKLIFQHFIPKERLSEQYVSNLFDGFDRSLKTLSTYFRVIEFQKEVTEKGRWNLLMKSFVKIALTKSHIISFKAAMPRLKENLQLSLNSLIVFNKELSIIQKKILRKLHHIKSSPSSPSTSITAKD